jgi:hypothetical protein
MVGNSAAAVAGNVHVNALLPVAVGRHVLVPVQSLIALVLAIMLVCDGRGVTLAVVARHVLPSSVYIVVA